MADSAAIKSPKGARQAIEPDTPPPPPNRSKAVRHPVVVFMNFILTVLILAVIAAGGLVYYGKQTFLEPGPLRKEKTILVSRGTGLATIAGILERQNVISNQTIFRYGVQLYQQEGALKAGEYLFSPGISMHQVMSILTSGKSILHSLTIPEGYTSYQVVEVLKTNDVLLGEIKDVPEEGVVLPETYKFSRGTTRAEMLKRMKSSHTRAVDEIWARRAPDLPLKDKREFVTLASIVEKETGMAAERTRVAGVFVNRLNQGMRLQTDPTVVYGIFGGKGKPSGRPIFRSDLDKPTPYNTYQIDGLPPGPIANPGRAALEAVANPSRTNELFFVADGTGGHVFSETLKQHNINVKRWRAIEKQRIEGLKKQSE
ncbi:endolytic transglycosylase MltG [Cohaesibacter sp. ES.047]|uniref:endolytic transglycosylase MltG n=1 Tax=Cohaesibacter sp. ES.047 TaxID=1798205 RepID=UPI000BB7566E